MFTFGLELRELLRHGTLHLIVVLGAIVWGLWLIRVFLARRYVPSTSVCSASVAAIIPVLDEAPELFTDVLTRIVAQRPDDAVVVINGPRNEALEQVCDTVGVRYLWTPEPGKRGAIALGVQNITADIAVLVDSDTLWDPGCLEELKKPFADINVGGVTTRQRIWQPHRSVWTRWADWLEAVRGAYALPAMSVIGQIGCLPGRTIAFRRSILADAMPKFLSEKFLGVDLVVSDDRSLTNYCLMAGYKTVFQGTAIVHTDAPVHIKKMWKQQLRWSRGSQCNTLRMLPWMLKNTKTLCMFYLSDIIVPFIVTGVVFGWAIRSGSGSGSDAWGRLLSGLGGAGLAIILTAAFAGVIASFLVRQWRALRDERHMLLWLVPFVIINIVFLIPVRIYGLARMVDYDGWGTRAGTRTHQHLPWRSHLPWLLAALLLVGGTVAGVLLHG